MSEIKSYAVFVEKPAKQGQNITYTVMEVKFDEDEILIAQRVAELLNEKRLRPLRAHEVLFKIYNADTAQDAANQARDEGMKHGHIPEISQNDLDNDSRTAFDFFGIKPPF